MTFWTLANLKQAARGQWLRPPANPDAPAIGVSIDTRTIRPGQTFIAIRGERFDGHDFLEPAADAGAALLLVDDHAKAESFAQGNQAPPILIVPDCEQALQQLASAYRDCLADRGVQVIAVTGSNGKTTTRRLIHAALAAKRQGSQSEKSFNNHLGLPLTLLAAHEDDDFLVAEIGTNAPGEIDALAAIARPDIAVITSIGAAHIGMLGGAKQGIAQEKTDLLRRLKPGGLAIVPGRFAQHDAGGRYIDPHLSDLPEHTRVLRFGDGSDPTDAVLLRDYQAGASLPDAGRTADHASASRFGVGHAPARFALSLPGVHNVANAMIAVAIARHLGVEDPAIARGLSNLAPGDMRFHAQQVGSPGRSVTLINDAYNANPDSVKASLATLAAWPLPAGAHAAHAVAAPRRVAILGDMLELGDQAAVMHREIGDKIRETDAISLVITIGKLAANIAAPLANAGESSSQAIDALTFETWSDALPQRIADLLLPGDVVLIKASRSMALERLVPAIESAFPETSDNATGDDANLREPACSTT